MGVQFRNSGFWFGARVTAKPLGVDGRPEPFSNHRCPAGNALGVHSVLFRGFENGENAALGRKTLFLDGN